VTKCEHGVYVPPGDDKARYCTLCTPLVDNTLHMKRRKVRKSFVWVMEEPVLDAVEFSQRSAGYRLLQGAADDTA
jgi:hypothetical protein